MYVELPTQENPDLVQAQSNSYRLNVAAVSGVTASPFRFLLGFEGVDMV